MKIVRTLTNGQNLEIENRIDRDGKETYSIRLEGTTKDDFYGEVRTGSTIQDKADYFEKYYNDGI